MPFENTIHQLIEKRALFVINHSGGKDSQAMYLYLTRQYKIPPELIRVIHAHLGVMEWDGIIEHITATTIPTNAPIIVESHKSFFDMVRNRNKVRPESPSFPSEQYRQCTSDLKRSPIEKEVRKICKEQGFDIVVSCLGLRAQESRARAKKEVFKLKPKLCTKARTWYEWLPIHSFLIGDVWGIIKRYKQTPFWIYQKGMRRCSCKVCIFHTKDDLRTVQQLDKADLLGELSKLEEETGSTMFRKGSIQELLAERDDQLKLF